MDATAASTRPPAGIVASTAVYGILGATAWLDAGAAGVADLALHGGRSGAGEPAGWVEAEGGWAVNRARRHLAWGVRASGFFLDYERPFRYRAGGAGLQPRVTASFGRSTLSLRGQLTTGTWSESGPDTLGADSLRSGALGMAGFTVAVGRQLGPASVEAALEATRGALDGWFVGPALVARLAAGEAELGASLRSWSTPAGNEIGFSTSAMIPAGDRTALWMEISRTQLDPLYGTPGSLGAGIGVSFRLTTSAPRRRPPVVELAEEQEGARLARFRFHDPSARSVAIAGDFTAWQPRAMERQDGDWTIEMRIAPGLHHFAFVVNDHDWTVPGDAPGLTTDEWGRRNATLVVNP